MTSHTSEIAHGKYWLSMISYHFFLARSFSGSGYLAIWTRVALLQIIVILKCMIFFFFLVWFSFQMPFTFSSSEIFNSILSCCLSHKASFTSTYCLLRQHLAFQSTLFALFLPISPLRIFPFICYFSKTSQQKLLCYLLFYSPKDKANNFANVRISGMR